jgi:hypothetical protein
MKELKIGDIVYNENMDRLNIIISPLLDTKEKAKEFMCNNEHFNSKICIGTWILLANKATELSNAGNAFYLCEFDEGYSLYCNPNGIDALFIGEL